jgi:hypothetical protein
MRFVCLFFHRLVPKDTGILLIGPIGKLVVCYCNRLVSLIIEVINESGLLEENVFSLLELLS